MLLILLSLSKRIDSSSLVNGTVSKISSFSRSLKSSRIFAVRDFLIQTKVDSSAFLFVFSTWPAALTHG